MESLIQREKTNTCVGATDVFFAPDDTAITKLFNFRFRSREPNPTNQRHFFFSCDLGNCGRFVLRSSSELRFVSYYRRLGNTRYDGKMLNAFKRFYKYIYEHLGAATKFDVRSTENEREKNQRRMRTTHVLCLHLVYQMMPINRSTYYVPRAYFELSLSLSPPSLSLFLFLAELLLSPTAFWVHYIQIVPERSHSWCLFSTSRLTCCIVTVSTLRNI